MDPNSLRVAIAALAGLVGGGGIGWWLRGRYNTSRSVMMEELWTRKIRSFEAEREKAVSAQIQAQTAQADLEKKLAAEELRAESLQDQVTELDHEGERLHGSLQIHQERIEKIELYAVELDKELKAAKQWRDASKEATETLHKRLRHLRTYPPRLEESEAELSKLKEEHVELLASKEAEIVRLTDWIAELTPLTETLGARDRELSAQRQRFEQSEARLDQQLVDVVARLDADKAAQTRLMEQLTEAQSDAAQHAREKATALEALDELRAELAKEREAHQQLAGSIQEERDAWEAQRQESIRLSLRVTELQMQIREALVAARKQQVSLEELKVELVETQAENSKAHRRLRDLEAEKNRLCELAEQQTQSALERREKRELATHDLEQKLAAAQLEVQRYAQQNVTLQQELQTSAAAARAATTRAEEIAAKSPVQDPRIQHIRAGRVQDVRDPKAVLSPAQGGAAKDGPAKDGPANDKVAETEPTETVDHQGAATVEVVGAEQAAKGDEVHGKDTTSNHTAAVEPPAQPAPESTPSAAPQAQDSTAAPAILNAAESKSDKQKARAQERKPKQVNAKRLQKEKTGAKKTEAKAKRPADTKAKADKAKADMAEANSNANDAPKVPMTKDGGKKAAGKHDALDNGPAKKSTPKKVAAKKASARETAPQKAPTKSGKATSDTAIQPTTATTSAKAEEPKAKSSAKPASGTLVPKGSKKKSLPKADPTKPAATKQTTGAKARKQTKPGKGRASAKKASSSSSISISTDDFSVITGIGPAVLKRLDRAGIMSYAQLVQLGRANVKMLAEQLGVSAKRIENEGWLESAEKLARRS